MIRRNTTYTTTVVATTAAVDPPTRHKPKDKEMIPSFKLPSRKTDKIIQWVCDFEGNLKAYGERSWLL